jgi:AcrR family transcriptional regulator
MKKQEPTPTSRGEQTRQAILEAAEQLFLTQGYNGTSMRQIARKAGNIAVSGIYNHFGGKEQIFRALLAARSPYDKVVSVLESLQSENPYNLLAETFERTQAIMREHWRFIALMLIDFQEFEGDTIREMIGAVLPAFARFAQKIHATQGFREDLEVFIVLRTFVSMMIGYTATQMVGYKDERPLLAGLPDIGDAEARRMMLDIFLHGVIAGEGKP